MARLALVHGLSILAALFLVAGLVVHLTRGHLDRQVDRGLADAVRLFAEGPAVEIGGGADPTRAVRRWLSVQSFDAGQQVAVRLGQDRVLASRSELDVSEIPGVADLLTTSERTLQDLDAGGRPVRVLGVPIEAGGDRLGTMVVIAERATIEDTLGALLAGIGWASLAGLLLAVALGVIALRRSLEPLSRVAEEASAIEETGDLGRRVAVEGASKEIAQVARAFDRMLERLETAFDRQRSFLAEASHELRTPLTVARGRLELMHENLSDPADVASLQDAMRELDRVAATVEELLLLARLDEGLDLERRPVEVDLVAREAILRGVRRAERAVAVEIPSDLTVLADPERLLQVLTNLVQNAVQHAGPTAAIRLTARREGDRVAIEVADTGTGIPPSELDRIFERHFRGRRSREDVAGGSGLGLAIARSLTHAMGGTITVTSEIERGTTFRVSLPEPS